MRLCKKTIPRFSSRWGTRGEGPWMCQNTLWKFQRAESLGNLLFLWKNVTGEMGDWHHKGPKIARAATHCQTRFRLRRWLLFCEVSGPEKEIGGVEIANYFLLLDMRCSQSESGGCPHERVLLPAGAVGFGSALIPRVPSAIADALHHESLVHLMQLHPRDT